MSDADLEIGEYFKILLIVTKLCLYFFYDYRFCVGDRFYLCDNKILCEYDYEERLVFANMAYNPSTLAQLKRQTNSLPVSPVFLL